MMRYGTRRQLLRMCAGGAFGLTLPELLDLRAAAAAGAAPGSRVRSFGRARSVVLLFMSGGPAHQDTWDLKPDAPAEVRGEFRPIRTKVPGIEICEHFPKLARVADKYAIIRSVTHPGIDHSTSTYEMLTGRRHPQPGERREPGPEDYPHLGSVVARFKPPQQNVPPFVALPEHLFITGGPDVPGQTGGFIGRRFDPFRVIGDFSKPGFQVPDVTLAPGCTESRLARRKALLETTAAQSGYLGASRAGAGFDTFHEGALSLLSASATRRAFALESEPQKVREAYGMHRHGQAVLVARRLVEAGVPFVSVYWHREKPTVDTTWDTHGNNFRELKDRLMPQVDQPHAALLQDLEERGLLDSTLVVWMGEFGRTPKINGNAGRDHWGFCGAAVLAGAGIRGGQVYGASDPTAAYPASDPVSPADIAATVYHSLGIDPRLEIRDQLDRPFPLAMGEPLLPLYG